MEKPEILFLVPIPPPYHGASLQSKMITNSKVLSGKFRITTYPLKFARNVSEIGKFSLRKLIKMMTYSYKLLIKLILSKPDLVYMIMSHRGYSFFRDCFFVIIVKLFRVKILFHQRNRGALEKSRKKLNRYLYNWIYKNNYSIALSPLLIYDVKPFVQDKKLFVVPNGIPEIKFNDVIKKKSKLTILFLSNLIIEKGVIILLKVLSSLRKKGYKFKGIFVGNWSYNIKEADFVRMVKDFELSEFVEVRGPMYDREKYIIFSQSDIFVFPTFMKHEAFPNVVLEAMRASLPVVTSNVASLPYMVEDGISGFICQKKNVLDFEQKLIKLIENKKLREDMGKKGRERFLRYFNFEKVEKDLARVLTKIVAD